MASLLPIYRATRVTDPIAEMDYVFRRLSGEPADQELTEVINQEQENLHRHIANNVCAVLTKQEAIEEVIGNLTGEVSETDLATPALLRLQNLKETLKKLETKHNKLIEQIKTNGAFLLATKDHTEELRINASKLKAAIKKSPAKEEEKVGTLLLIGECASRTLA